ncbi:siderophore-iron reductase FhuF [Kaistia sp. 32K]|uniref:siderophore-iron reductase FhuF n=1 Tax=Kaistia sp. 32K TaxID=2795690 RepID=UPI00191526EF|nr:siderophore-iron reductase FhuF [Kaistia sp. 32K]BCP55568.1 siderophore-iron reductase FhuF [Kaistia sp. 32K]
MIPALAPVFRGSLERYGAQLVPESDPRPFLAGKSLLDPERLRPILEQFGRKYPGGDKAAIATQWSKWHFSTLLVPILAANLLADLDLPVELERIGVVLDEDGHTAAIRLGPDIVRFAPASAAARFARVTEEHLAPLIGAIRATSGLPEKVLWSNAGNVAENVLRECEASLGADHPGVAQGAALLAARLRPDGSRNPLFEPIRYVGGARRRRVCCLRYLIETLGYCKSCPLAQARKET